jgi:23S rRNA (adenine2503-C2)-methyltransferase
MSTDHTPPPLPSLTYPPEWYDNQGRLMIKNLTFPALTEWCISIGETENRAMQLWRWMYHQDRTGTWISNIGEAGEGVQNGFSALFSEKFNEMASMDGGLQLSAIHTASDGTRKLVFDVIYNNNNNNPSSSTARVEAVLIPIVREHGSKSRLTLCVSSQLGCAMNCQFCQTGRMGLLGNLTAAQIIEQLVVAKRLLSEEAIANSPTGSPLPAIPITNVVYMGMGEPMNNLSNVLPSVDIMCHPMGLHMSHNKVTVSTVGLIPELKEFVASTNVLIAVSIHAPREDTRDWIVPVNKKYPLRELVRTLEELFPNTKEKGDILIDEDGENPSSNSGGSSSNNRREEETNIKPKRKGRYVLIEYVMLKDINDTEEDASALVRLLRNVRCKINLIVFNTHEGTQFEASTKEAVAAFRGVLIKEGGHVATVRDSRGDDSMAACGQLGVVSEVRKKKMNTAAIE